jgi:hypothetical protein
MYLRTDGLRLDIGRKCTGGTDHSCPLRYANTVHLQQPAKSISKSRHKVMLGRLYVRPMSIRVVAEAHRELSLVDSHPVVSDTFRAYRERATLLRRELIVRCGRASSVPATGSLVLVPFVAKRTSRAEPLTP